MVIHEDRERIKGLLAETITLLCKNGLNYNSEFCIEALIGITLDKDDVFLVSIKETVRSLEKELLRGLPCYSDDEAAVALDEDEEDTKEDLSQIKERLSKGGSPQSSPHRSRRRHRRSLKERHSLESASSVPGNTEPSSMPNLSLQDMDNDGGDIWQSLTPHNQTTVRGLEQDGDSTKEHLLHSSTDATSAASDSRKPFSYVAGTDRDFVVIKDEPQSDEDGMPQDSGLDPDDSMLPAGESVSNQVRVPHMAHLERGGEGGGENLSVSAPTHPGARLWQDGLVQDHSPAVMEGTSSSSSFDHQQQQPQSVLRFHPNKALMSSWEALVDGAESADGVTCSDCGRSFMRTEHLVLHRKHHHGQGDYQCTICDKRFTLKHHMKQHMAKHDMSPQYMCPRCGIKIRYKPNVIRHLKRCAGNQQNIQQSMHTSAIESPSTLYPQGLD